MTKKETAEWYEREILRLEGIIDLITDKRTDDMAKNIVLQTNLIMCRAALAELQGIIEAIVSTSDLIKIVMKKTEGFDCEEINQIRKKQ